MNKNIRKKVFFCAFLALLLNFHAVGQDEDFKTAEKALMQFYESAHAGKTSLLQSFLNTSSFLDDTLHGREEVMKTDGDYLGNQSFTYDMGIVSMACILMKDYKRAESILDDFSDNFGIKKNGLTGLYNSYLNQQYDYYYLTPSGKRNFLIIGIDGSRIHAGPVLWVGLACQHYYAETGSRRYISFLCDIFKWCAELRHYTMPDGSAGGISMGYGWGLSWERIFCTEHNIDYYAFLKHMKKIISTDDFFIREIFQEKKVSLEMIRKETDSVLRWLKAAYKPETGMFLRGINLQGEDSIGALDTVSWGMASLGPQWLEKSGIDPLRMLQRAEDSFRVKVTVEGKTYEGFDFTDKRGYSKRRKEPCIWFEGTGQMIVLYSFLARYYSGKSDFSAVDSCMKKADYFLREITRFSEELNFPNQSLPYTSLNLQGEDVAYAFFDWWPIARGKEGKWVLSAVSTSWKYFAQKKFNPLDLDFSRAGK